MTRPAKPSSDGPSTSAAITSPAVASPAVALLERLAVAPAEPWLFVRRAWNWRWQTYAQAADQVVRTIRALRKIPPQAAESAHEPLLAAFIGTQSPDAVLLFTALMAHGGVGMPLPLASDLAGSADSSPVSSSEPSPVPPGVPVQACWLHVSCQEDSPRQDDDGAARAAGSSEDSPDRDSAGRPIYSMPRAVGHLDRRPLEALTWDDMPSTADSALGETAAIFTLDGRRVPLAQLGRRAQALADAVRPLLEVKKQLRRRPVLCASPQLAPIDLWVVAWATLLLDAAWMLEPDADAFEATVTWVRPMVVVVPPSDAAAVHRAVVSTPKWHRRLKVVAQLGAVDEPSPAGERVDPQVWDALGIAQLDIAHPVLPEPVHAGGPSSEHGRNTV